MANKKNVKVAKHESIYDKIARNAYDSSLKRPMRNDFKIIEVLESRIKGSVTISGYDNAAYKAAQDAFYSDRNALRETFNSDALFAARLTDHPKASRALTMAWIAAERHQETSCCNDDNLLLEVVEQLLGLASLLLDD